MRSLYDAVFGTIAAHMFTIPGTTVRKPYSEADKTYPMFVLHEVVNIPKTHASVSGEQRTTLAYQVDILTRDCIDTTGVVVGRWKAGRRLAAELSDLLDRDYKITRRNLLDATRTPATGLTPDVMEFIWRGDCVMDSYDYVYRA